MTYTYFQYQVHTEPVSTSPETVTEDRWHQPWSEPRRFPRWPLMAASGWYGSLGAGTAETIFEDKWHFAWSEPIVKTKIGLRAGSQQFIAYQPQPFTPPLDWYLNLTEPVRVKPRLREGLQKVTAEGFIQPVFLDWFNWLSEPKRFLRGTPSPAQPFFQFQPRPIIDIGWFQGFSEPVRIKPGLKSILQKVRAEGFPQPVLLNWFSPLSEPRRGLRPIPLRFEAQLSFNIINITENFGWYSPFSEPKRFLRGIKAMLQRELLRAEFIPFSYTLSMDAIEQGDFLKAVLKQFNIPTHAYVDIIEKNPHYLANMGIIENVAEPSIVSIIEPEAASLSGSAVPTVASARVAIILT